MLITTQNIEDIFCGRKTHGPGHVTITAAGQVLVNHPRSGQDLPVAHLTEFLRPKFISNDKMGAGNAEFSNASLCVQNQGISGYVCISLLGAYVAPATGHGYYFTPWEDKHSHATETTHPTNHTSKK